MKANKKWLNEYVDCINEDINYIADKLTITGTKVETIDSFGKNISNVVIGKIISIEKHPDADKLVVTKVDVKDDILQIATGAKNITVGDIIPVAKIGAKLPNGLEIKLGNLRGIDSYGMMCSESELGVPHGDDKGIWILDKSLESKLGENIVTALELDDNILDFEITPNRPDCLGILGIGRELSVALNKEFKGYKVISRKEFEDENILNIVNEFKDLKVNVLDNDCKKYACLVLENVIIKESPDWMQKRLKALGINPKNNIVDLTNYIMLELGQPVHAFDKDVVGNTLNIRKANENEEITLLNDETYILDKELVIANDEKALAIAGVMGSNIGSVNENTKNVIIEIANFDGPRTRRASKSLALRTDASTRFEKNLPISYIYTAIKRIKEINEKINIGTLRNDVILQDNEDEKVTIPLDVQNINNLLGINISKEEIIKILTSLEFVIQNDQILVPCFRKDVNLKADIVEEVIRIYGFDKLETTLPKTADTNYITNNILEVKQKILNFLIHNGYNQICTYGFTNYESMTKLHLDSDDERIKNIIPIKNILSADYSIMRTTMIPSILDVVKTNFNFKNTELNIFDLSKIYLDNGNMTKGEIPTEYDMLGIATTNTFMELKNIIYRLLEYIGLNRFKISRSEDKLYHPGKSAKLSVGNDVIANFGEIHPVILKEYGIKNRVNVLELNLTKILKYISLKEKYTEVSKFPAVERDLSFVVDENIMYDEIEEIVKKEAKKYLEKVELFDIFRDKEKIGENKKSIAISLFFRDKNQTLSEEIINELVNKIINSLEHKLNIQLRK